METLKDVNCKAKDKIESKAKNSRIKSGLKSQRAITLVALVVTIVVLLILAGITMSTLFNENGIINQAINSGKQTDIAGTREQIELELMGKYDTEGKYTNADVIEAVKAVTGQTIEEGTATIITAKGNEVDISDLWGETVATSSKWTADYATLTVTNGKQTLKIADAIDYDPLAKVTDSVLLSYTSSTGTYVSDDYASASNTVERGSGWSSKQTFSASDYTGTWRLLGVDDSGQLLIMSNENIGTLALRGQTGATYGMDELDNISNIFGHGTGATGARSITVDDINKITGYNPEYTGINTNTTEITDSTAKAPYGSGSTNQYGNTVTYNWGTTRGYITSTNSISGISGVTNKSSSAGYYNNYGFNWHDNDFNWTRTASSTRSKICDLTATGYTYYLETLTDSSDTNATTGIANGSAAYNMIVFNDDGSKRSFWMASSYVSAGTSGATFGLFMVYADCVTTEYVYRSFASNTTWLHGVVPVVSLSSGVKLTIDETKTTDSVTYWNIEF